MRPMRADSFEAKLKWLDERGNRALLASSRRGIEKECLRVGRDGHLSKRPHSPAFGSALTHPYLTTDYSEALLELVTPPDERLDGTLEFLDEIHAFIVRHLDDELLWPASMPCIINADESVPIAQYGPSNEGRFRTIYRSGLGLRYGRAMQAIAGVHFNYSLGRDYWDAEHERFGGSAESAGAARDRDSAGAAMTRYRSDRYMGMIRNFRRVGWLIPYLFGASPAFCKSFRPQGHDRLESLDADTWYAPYATSLRMSDMGYRNSTQARLSVSVNSLERYIDELTAAVTTVEPSYEAIGVVANGEYRQLNANVLQIENEYYSAIRPKPATKRGRLLDALAAEGVEYVEVRTLDLNPFAPAGVAAHQARFIETLLLYCLSIDSPPISEQEKAEINERELSIAWRGRQSGLEIVRDGRAVTLKSWALEIVDALTALAELLDDGERGHTAAVESARDAIGDADATLSAELLRKLTESRQSFFEFCFAQAEAHRSEYADYGFAPGRLEALEALAAESLTRQAEIEAAPTEPFADYLEA
ncbi:MAG: glutamate--cysteine ligase [Gammaproteobacteria bacterium]|nr:glutamate--cysteine ligase [Gammaproteobacteria bacterium]